MAKIRIGTSGWSYAHWKGVLYPPGVAQGRWLDHYATEFDTVELNATFYRLPPESTFQGWRNRVPDRFLFSVKASKSITHLRQLSDCQQEVDSFCSRARLLGEHLGPILLQLPPGGEVDIATLAEFLARLPEGVRFAFEFRHQSWFCPEVYELLRRRGAALVRVSAPRYPDAPVTTADFQYLRMHGEGSLYASQYSEASLSRWGDEIAGWAAEGQEVFVYFNNDAHGYAVHDARRLRQIINRSH